MSVAEEGSGLLQSEYSGGRVEGNENQVVESVSNSNLINSVGGNVTFEAAKRVTSLFQLPRAIDDFTGRRDELAEIEQVLIGEEKPRTLAVSAVAGMAGVGKSALVIQAAHRVKGQFPDAQLYVNLQGADAQPRDPSDVLGEWLRALGLEGAEIPTSLSERQRAFRSQLANRRALVVLDNAQDEAQIRPLLPGGERCGVLVTSRRPLAALAGTKEIRLKTLPAPDAVTLLGEIAGQVRVAAEPEEAAEIVRLCGYLPLAIRIAGGVLKGKPHWQLAADYMPLLRNEQQRLGRLAQSKGEDVRASFNLSHRQLNRAEQRLFAALGVLPADFDLQVAAAVSGQVPEEAQTHLEALIDAQLVEVDGTGRYRYHDLMRLYAKELLAAGIGKAEERFFIWYFMQASFWQTAFSPVQRRRWVAAQNEGEVNEAAESAFLQQSLAWFEAERNNLLVAFDWGYTQRKQAETIAFAANLVNFFIARSYWQDWETTHLKALAAAKESENLQGQGQTLNNLGSVYQCQGRWVEAIERYKASLEICRSLGNLCSEGITLNNLGLVYGSQRRWVEALERYKASLEICHSLGDLRGKGQVLSNFGNVYGSQGRWVEAIERYKASLEICRRLGDRPGEGITLMNLGIVYDSQGRWVEAIKQHQASLEICRSLGDRHGEGNTLNNLGSVYKSQGRWAEAIAQYQNSLEIFRSLGDRHGEGNILNNLGLVYRSQGRWAEAIAQHQNSLEIRRSLGNRHGEGQTLNNLGNVYQSQGRWAEAITQHQNSLEICRSLNDRHGEGDALNNLGSVYQSQGRWAEAITQYQNSLEIKRSLGDHHGEGLTLANLGNLYAARIQYPKALEYWQAAKAKIHPDSPEAKQLEKKLQNPYNFSKKQLLIGCLPQLALLAFTIVNLFRGHWLIALLIILAWGSFYVYRIWRIRRDRG